MHNIIYLYLSLYWRISIFERFPNFPSFAIFQRIRGKKKLVAYLLIIERVANICILKNCIYRGYTFMTFQRFNINLRNRKCQERWTYIYILAHLYIQALSSLSPSFCYISKKDEREIGWLFQKLLKGLQIYVYSRNCLYLGYTYMNIQRFKINLRKKGITVSLLAIIEGIFII